MVSCSIVLGKDCLLFVRQLAKALLGHKQAAIVLLVQHVGTYLLRKTFQMNSLSEGQAQTEKSYNKRHCMVDTTSNKDSSLFEPQTIHKYLMLSLITKSCWVQVSTGKRAHYVDQNFAHFPLNIEQKTVVNRRQALHETSASEI